jgi:hypothetical protein
VFFFMCNHGSKVFFDALGDPWPRHEDSCIPYQIRLTRSVTGMSSAQVRRLIETEAQQRGIAIPSLTQEHLDQIKYAETRRPTTVRLKPGDGPKQLAGFLANVNQRVNFFKRYGYPDNAIGRGLLGSLATKPFVELTIRTEPDQKTGIRFEATAFAPESLYVGSGAELDAPVDVLLESRQMKSEIIWLIVRMALREN